MAAPRPKAAASRDPSTVIDRLLAAANGRRRGNLLTREVVDRVIEEAQASDHGLALRHAGRTPRGMGSAFTTLCLAMRRPDGVVVGISYVHGHAKEPTPSERWPELGPWRRDLARNVAKVKVWAATRARDRVLVPAPATTPVQDGVAHRIALLAEIHRRPDDDQPRLVLADDLTAHGDPRGELITIQCTLARAPRSPKRRALLAREAALLAAHRDHWISDAMRHARRAEIRRGFVACVAMDAARWSSHGARILVDDPIEELVVIGTPTAVGLHAIAGAAHSSRLRILRFERPYIISPGTPARLAAARVALHALFTSPNLAALETIDLTCDGDDEDRASLGSSFPRLAWLE